jgi:hypothetical protein
MGDSQGILGFTEAELGFFLALLCIVLWVSAMPTKAQTTMVQIPADSVQHLKARTDSLLNEAKGTDSLKSALTREKQISDSLRSRLLPPCTALKKAVGPLATVEVHSGGQIVVNGQPTTLDDFDKNTADVRQAVQGICRQQVIVRFADGLSVRQSEGVRSRLSAMLFYVSTGPFLPQE